MHKALKLVYATCFLDVSGVTKINFDILSGLAVNWEIHVCVTQRDDQPPTIWDKRFKEVFGEPLDLWRIPARERYCSFVSFLVRYQIDLVYITHSLWLYEHVARLKRDLPGVRFIDSLHVLEPYCFRGGYPDISANRFVHPYIDMSILISHDLRQYLIRNYPVNPEKLVVVHNGIDSGGFKRQIGAGHGLRTELELSPTDKLIGFIGRFAVQKRPLFFLEIARDLCKYDPHVRLYMVGSGPLSGKIRRFIARNDLNGKIHLLENRDDIPSLLNVTELLLLPSAYEGAPLTILEALSVGVPVVASDVGAVREYVNDMCRLVPLGRGGAKEREKYVISVRECLAVGGGAGFLAPEHKLDEVIARYHRIFEGAVV
jgi:glycosyltransferase involved in cell wall biosynthesis